MEEQRIQDARKRAADKRDDRERTTCVHFTGIGFMGKDSGMCKVGVPYDQFADSTGKLFGNIPCTNTAIDSCRFREFPTEEQVQADRLRDEQRMENFAKAHKAAKDHAKSLGLGRGHGGRGSIDCPVCVIGTLRYSVAGVNGHMHGSCTTEGCMSWME